MAELKLATLLVNLKKAKEKADKSAAISAKDNKVYEDLKNKVVAKMNKEKLDKAKAKGISISVSQYDQEVVDVADWKKFYAYIYRHKAFELLNKQAKASAVKELINDKKKVPGVKIVSIPKLSVTIRSI